MSNTNYCQKNGDVILNRARDRLRQQARDKCKNLSEEKKNEEREYGKNRYHSMSEEKNKN